MAQQPKEASPVDNPRIVSLLCSATEIVSALGFRDNLVGRSHECDYPAGVEALPSCTTAKFDLNGTSGQIDDRVRELVQNGLSPYQVDDARLRDLRPDIIVTQDQCQVCAASLTEVEAAVRDWTDHQATIVSHNPNLLEDVRQDIERTADALGASDRGRELTAACRARVEAVREITSAAAEMIDAAGGEPVFGEPGVHSGTIEWETYRAANPDVILVIPCGFDLAQIERDLPNLLAMPGWAELDAVKAGRVYMADGHQYFNRPGPRLADSVEILGEMLHPEIMPADHEGAAWRRIA
jgi:iron complex transport system substrate-binding protein